MRALALASIMGLSCAHAPTPTPAVSARFAWLVGTWASETEDRRNVETWRAVDDHLEGSNRTWVEGKIVHRERLELIRVQDDIVYRAHPEGQATNDFVLEASGEGWARFVDPSHDWPQSITYRREGDQLDAVVEGTHGGQPRRESWRWQRESSG